MNLGNATGRELARSTDLIDAAGRCCRMQHGSVMLARKLVVRPRCRLTRICALES